MTVACLTLLHDVARPIWPWSPVGTPGLLAEAFPAAQLRSWGLPCVRYNGSTAGALETRRQIIRYLRDRMNLNLGEFEAIAVSSADALDAILSGFAAIAVTSGALENLPDGDALREGWIAVHRAPR